MLKKSFSRARRQDTGDNPPLAPPPPRRGIQPTPRLSQEGINGSGARR
ncbi:MAG: hypothetical protein F6K48_14850 [Okeania sp. SIO3H1]|nr:hypothetical protein [Okeania sp. SIO3H1]